MSINKKELSNNKEKFVTSINFLDQLRNVIHKPKAELRKSTRNEQKDRELNMKSNENTLKTEKNNDINSNNKDEKTQKIGLDSKIKENDKQINDKESDSDYNRLNKNDKIINNENNLIKKEIDEASIKINNNDTVKYSENIQKEEEKKNVSFPKEQNNSIIKEKEENEMEEKVNNEQGNFIHKGSKESIKSNNNVNHKVCPSCLNKCIKWTLKAEIKSKNSLSKNFKSKYNLKGTSIFFKNLDYSLLNMLHNSFNLTKLKTLSNETFIVDTHELLEKIKILEKANANQKILSNMLPESEEYNKKLEKINYIAINNKTQIITPTQKGEIIYDVSGEENRSLHLMIWLRSSKRLKKRDMTNDQMVLQ